MRNLITIYLLCAFGSYAQTSQQLIDSITANNIFEGAIVGVAGFASPEYLRFQRLTKIVSKKELYALTNHKNGVLRMYASTYLIEEIGADPVPLFLSELERNEQIETLNGCTGDYEYTSGIIYNSYSYKINGDGSALQQMDSIVITTRHPVRWLLYSKVFDKTGLPAKLLPAIEELAFERNNPYAIGYLVTNFPGKYIEKANAFYVNNFPSIKFDENDETSMAFFIEFVELMLQTGDKTIQDIAVKAAKNCPFANDSWFIDTFKKYGIKL